MPQDNLLLYNHAKLMAEDNHSSGKEYLVSIMFSHYDQNNNGALEREELEQVCSQAAFVFNLQNYAVDTVQIFCWVGDLRCNLSH
jgi:Ca2+-binding EF-hand superfamily protein